MRLNKQKGLTVALLSGLMLWSLLPILGLFVPRIDFSHVPGWTCWFKLWFEPEHPIWGFFAKAEWVTHGDCFSCGMTRAIQALLRGEYVLAKAYHPYVIPCVLFFVGLWVGIEGFLVVQWRRFSRII